MVQASVGWYSSSTALAKVSSWPLWSHWEGDTKGNGHAQHSDLLVPPYEWTACGHTIFTCEHKCLARAFGLFCVMFLSHHRELIIIYLII